MRVGFLAADTSPYPEESVTRDDRSEFDFEIRQPPFLTKDGCLEQAAPQSAPNSDRRMPTCAGQFRIFRQPNQSAS
jgi:hypothetical protein